RTQHTNADAPEGVDSVPAVVECLLGQESRVTEADGERDAAERRAVALACADVGAEYSVLTAAAIGSAGVDGIVPAIGDRQVPRQGAMNFEAEARGAEETGANGGERSERELDPKIGAGVAEPKSHCDRTVAALAPGKVFRVASAVLISRPEKHIAEFRAVRGR